jgi:hypothetical protein
MCPAFSTQMTLVSCVQYSERFFRTRGPAKAGRHDRLKAVEKQWRRRERRAEKKDEAERLSAFALKRRRQVLRRDSLRW